METKTDILHHKDRKHADEFKKEMDLYLVNTLHTTFEDAGPAELYKAVATVINRRLGDKRLAYNKKRADIEKHRSGRKKVCYICMEFLMGRSLKNNLYNLGETETVARILEKRGMVPEDLYEQEPDAGLGNGGLGRLAACYLDALTASGYDATGYSLCYEYGLFKQKVIDGWQVELPDNWLPGGRVWLNPREDDVFKVSFYGDYKEYWTEDGMKYELKDPQIV